MFWITDIHQEARKVGCFCPDSRKSMGKLTKDELREFFSAPSKDELADTLVTASRWLTGAQERFIWVPFYRIRLEKELERLHSHGCIRSERHLKDQKCPNNQKFIPIEHDELIGNDNVDLQIMRNRDLP